MEGSGQPLIMLVPLWSAVCSKAVTSPYTGCLPLNDPHRLSDTSVRNHVTKGQVTAGTRDRLFLPIGIELFRNEEYMQRETLACTDLGLEKVPLLQFRLCSALKASVLTAGSTSHVGNSGQRSRNFVLRVTNLHLKF